MTARLASIWRHPVKGLGREALEGVALEAGRTLPWDRHWAVAHEGARLDGPGWAPCRNFLRAAASPALMAVEARLDEAAGTVTLTHPERPPITLDPERDGPRLVEWARPLVAEGRPAPASVRRADGQGLTDASEPFLSIYGAASHRAVEARVGRELSIHRWRGNLWVEGLEPWEEMGWLGRRVRLGEAELEVAEVIGRCRATESSPETGRRDADTLGALKALRGETEFGVYARVVRDGAVAVGDPVEAL